MAQLVVAEDDDGTALPDWFLVEIARDLPRLVAGGSVCIERSSDVPMAKNSSAGDARNRQAILDGTALCAAHPLTSRLPWLRLDLGERSLELDMQRWLHVGYIIDEPHPLWRTGLWTAYSGVVRPNLRRRAPACQWAYVFARVQLHQALNHLDPARATLAWHAACWYHAEAILSVAGLGERPPEIPPLPQGVPKLDVEHLGLHYENHGISSELRDLSLAATHPYWRHSGRGLLTSVLPTVLRWRQAFGRQPRQQSMLQVVCAVPCWMVSLSRVWRDAREPGSSTSFRCWLHWRRHSP